jgi:hypothetical protein
MTVLAVAEISAEDRARLTQPAKETKLRLPRSRAMPRELIIGWTQNGASGFFAYGHAFIKAGPRSVSVAFAAASIPDSFYLSYTGSCPTLWLAHEQFDLTESEALEVERVFGPLGLQIERRKS